MIAIGKFNQLKIANFAPFGAYLDAETGKRADNILLPKKQVPPEASVGEALNVFVYRDSENRLIATVREPLAQVGELAYLKVTAKTSFGAFLDIGLERGLFLPFSEQRYPVEMNKSYLVYLYLDKSERICCTTDIYQHLTSDSLYDKNDKVVGTVYLVKADVGVFVAVDDQVKGLIPLSECYRTVHEGDRVEARVIRVREDGKLDLSLRDLAYKQVDADGETVYQSMLKNQGYLCLSEKDDSKKIEQEFHMSKAAFKRAIGNLLKAGKITKTEKGLKVR